MLREPDRQPEGHHGSTGGNIHVRHDQDCLRTLSYESEHEMTGAGIKVLKISYGGVSVR